MNRLLKSLLTVLLCQTLPALAAEPPTKAASENSGGLEMVAAGLRLAEAPLWDGEGLLFCDVFPSKIHKLGADGTVSTIRSDTRKETAMQEEKVNWLREAAH